MNYNSSIKKNISVTTKLNHLQKNEYKTKLYPSCKQMSSPNRLSIKPSLNKIKIPNCSIASSINHNPLTQSCNIKQKHDNHTSSKNNFSKNKYIGDLNISKIKKIKNSNGSINIYNKQFENNEINCNKNVYLIVNTNNNPNKIMEKRKNSNKTNNKNINDILNKLENNNNIQNRNNKFKNISESKFCYENKTTKNPKYFQNSTKNLNLKKYNLNLNESKNKNIINIKQSNFYRKSTNSNNNNHDPQYINTSPTEKNCRLNTFVSSSMDENLLNILDNKKDNHKNLMVNYKIIKIKNNINNINNNTNHYNYNNYLLNSETKPNNNNVFLNSLSRNINLIEDTKNNNGNYSNKFLSANHYMQNDPTKKKKIMTPNHYASLCKNIVFYNKFYNTFYKAFNTNNNKMNNKNSINVNRRHSLSPNNQAFFKHIGHDDCPLEAEKYSNLSFFYNDRENNKNNKGRNIYKKNSLSNVHNFNRNKSLNINLNINSTKNKHLKTLSTRSFDDGGIINKTEESKIMNKLIKNKLLDKNINNEINSNSLNDLEKNNNGKFTNTCTIKSKINNYMDQANSINYTGYTNNTIQNKQNSMRVYIKPGVINKMAKSKSKNNYLNVITNDNKVTNQYEIYKKNDVDEFLNHKDKIMHFSRSEYFDNELLSNIKNKKNKFDYKYENNLNDKDKDIQKKLLLNRINIKTSYGGFYKQNKEKLKLNEKNNVIEIKKKKNYCFINKLYCYYIKISKLTDCFYTKITEKNNIKNKEISVYNRNNNCLSKKCVTLNKKIINTEKTYIKEINDNSDFQLNCGNIIQEPQTYNKETYNSEKNNLIYKFKENTSNIENKEKIFEGLRKLMNFFDKKNYNIQNIGKIDLNNISARKNIAFSKILKNTVNERIRSYIKIPRNNKISNENKIVYKDSLINESYTKNFKTYNYEYILSLKNKIYSLKDNLLSEKIIRHSFELFIQSDFELISNNIVEPDENYFITEINKNQPKNSFEFEIMNLLNALTNETFDNIFSQILHLLLINKQNINLFIENEKILLKIIFSKASNEYCYGFIYAKLCSILNTQLINEFLDTKNSKNNKERTIKFLVNEESNNVFNSYKNMQINDLVLNKNKFLGYLNFISELMIIELIRQQFIFYIFDQMYQKYIENETEVIYLEGCIELINNAGKYIIEKENNTKYISNLNKYFNETFPNLISNKISLPNNIKYKIINLLEKNKNGWTDSLYESSKSFNNISKNSLLFSFDFQDTNISSNDNFEIPTENSKTQDKISVKNIIEKDLLNFIKYSNDSNDKPPSYNWEIIDKLINEKKIQIYKIAIYYIKICKNIIVNEKDIICSNDYIKNIIEYYINNLSKNDIDITRNEMIKFFKNINEVIREDEKMYKIMGNLLFVLVENRLFLIKDFNNYLKENKNTIINLALVTKYCIISSGKYAKKYYNDFRQNKLFINNSEIFKKNVSDSLKDLFYYIK